MVFLLEDTKKAEPLLGNWPETLIWSCLQKVMGRIYVDDLERPHSAMAVIGDFTFFAGVPNGELVIFKAEDNHRNYTIMVPENDGWSRLMEAHYGQRAGKSLRYAIKKEAVFDRDKLQSYAAGLPEEFEFQLIDEELFHWCKEHGWSRDFVVNYEGYEQYKNTGLGVVAVKDGQPVAGASSYTSYNEGIEIEIDTLPEYRRRGLATACGAKLILECLKRGWYPSWDAQNLWSVGLSQKLGYEFDHEYVVYLIEDY